MSLTCALDLGLGFPLILEKFDLSKMDDDATKEIVMPYQRFVKEGEYELFSKHKFRFVTINLMSAKEKAIQDGLTLFWESSTC